MSQNGVTRLSEALNDTIDYYKQEYDLNYAEVIGVLMLIVGDYQHEALEESDDDPIA